MESWRKELYHHGIKGQKWGVKNGPPYPLKPEKHSLAERRSDPTFGRKANNEYFGGSSSKKDRSDGIKVDTSKLGDVSGVKKFSGNPNDPKVLRELDIQTTIDVMSKKFPKRDWKTQVRKEFDDHLALEDISKSPKNFSSIKDIPKYSDVENTIENASATINARLSSKLTGNKFNRITFSDVIKISKTDPGALQENTANCQFCSIAYEMSRRGYKVAASPRKVPGGADIFSKAFKLKDENSIFQVNSSKKGSDMLSALEKQLESYGDDARGSLRINVKDGGGHAISWEKKGGQLTVVDSQVNAIYSGKDLNKYFSKNVDNTWPITCIRTDNAEINEEAMVRICDRVK